MCHSIQHISELAGQKVRRMVEYIKKALKYICNVLKIYFSKFLIHLIVSYVF